MKDKEVVRGVCKRDKENSFPFILKGKSFSIIGIWECNFTQGKMILYSFTNQIM